MTVALMDPAGKVLSWIENLDVLAWALLGAAVALTWLVWRGVIGRSRLGTIDVDPIKSDDEPKLTIVAATAELQRQLADIGLLPPGGVPAGSPTAKIVAAVESAPIEQAKWLASLIDLLPIPPSSTSFKVTCTLRADGDKPRSHGLTYKVVDAATGACVVMDTAWEANTGAAIASGTNAIYRAICAHATDAVPPWARWKHPQALAHYRAALSREKDPDSDVEHSYSAALRELREAGDLDPDNMVVRLRNGNCLERLAGCEELQSDKRTKLWVEALYKYAGVRLRHEEIVEARYRLSVVLGLVADHFSDSDEEAKEALRSLLASLEPKQHRLTEEDGDEKLRQRLREAAKAESKAAWKRLRPLWVICHERRLRHAFEPRGKERRQMRKALAMSYMCLRMRRHWHRDPHKDDPPSIPWGVRAIPRVCWRWWARCRYLALRWRTAGWQTHYNAAAFYALMPEASVTGDATVWGDRLRARAFAHLEQAIGDSDNDLRCAYVRREDADLENLRRLEKARWRADVVERLCVPETVLHYRRADMRYRSCRLELGDGMLTRATNGHRALELALVDDFGALFKIPIHDTSQRLEFRLLNRNGSDAGLRSFIPAQMLASEVWIVAGDPKIYTSRPPGS